MARKKKEISVREINRYARLCAQHNRLEKERYAYRDELLNKLDGGHVPVDHGPFLLALWGQERIDPEQFSWKMYATQLAIELAEGDVGAGMARIVKAELEAPRKTVRVLAAKPNPVYGMSFAAAR